MRSSSRVYPKGSKTPAIIHQPTVRPYSKLYHCVGTRMADLGPNSWRLSVQLHLKICLVWIVSSPHQ